jgi:NTE family protein
MALPFETVRRFRNADILEGLADSELAQIASIAELVNYNAGDMIRRQGERQEFALVIGSGSVGLYLVINDEEIAVRIFSAGQTVGTGAFLSNPIATTTARALTQVTGLKLPRADLLNLMESHPRTGYEIMKGVAEASIRRIRGLYETIADLEKRLA